mmetsp:Transcript_33844/g.74240  ORF Transcript_33844/g.74240 Transcript_33844/m.74240 type:complete len:205 (-) Transcript_33844:231-845(-)
MDDGGGGRSPDRFGTLRRLLRTKGRGRGRGRGAAGRSSSGARRCGRLRIPPRHAANAVEAKAGPWSRWRRCAPVCGRSRALLLLLLLPSHPSLLGRTDGHAVSVHVVTAAAGQPPVEIGIWTGLVRPESVQNGGRGSSEGEEVVAQEGIGGGGGSGRCSGASARTTGSGGWSCWRLHDMLGYTLAAQQGQITLSTRSTGWNRQY